jgi:L-seryl-tRNA(Ser) seleniumtransferase
VAAANLPPVNDLLDLPVIRSLMTERGRDVVRTWVRESFDELRQRVLLGDADGDRAGLLGRLASAVLHRAESDADVRLGRVINATGVVLHTSLGRAPLSDAAITAIADAAHASNLEVDLATGDRRYRGYQLQSAWQTLTGAEAALIVNNNAAATVLVLQALCQGREVVISRGQLIEIGGSFRLPEIFGLSGAILREVGTTNQTHLDDYVKAIGPNTAAILRVHPSNFRVEGFAATPEIDELARLAKQHGVLCIDDIGSGCVCDSTKLSLPAEPTFRDSLSSGADVVLGSGDKLLGGPQCGILLGRSDLIARVRHHPLARAVRVDKLTLAALSATLDSYLRGTAEQDIPVLRMLATSADELHARAERLREALVGTTSINATVASETAAVGGGSLPTAELPTVVFRLQSALHSAAELAQRLRCGTPRVFPRVQSDAVLLDLRSVLPHDDEDLTRAVRALEGP